MKTMRDVETIHYRYRQLEKLDRTANEYLPTIQIHDSKGNKTNCMNIGYDELNQIVKVLVGKYKPRKG